MSTYYSYYIGKLKDGKIYPLMNYDASGNLYPVLTKSSSFEHISDEFWKVPRRMWSEEFANTIGNYKYDEGENIRYLEEKEFGDSNYIKRGYYLTSDVETYLNSGEDPDVADDLFYEKMSEFAYAARLKNEILFGPPKDEVNEDGESIETHSCGDYTYFTYADYYNAEYEWWLLKQAISTYKDEHYEEAKDDYVAILVID